jgi:hypothetical protein
MHVHGLCSGDVHFTGLVVGPLVSYSFQIAHKTHVFKMGYGTFFQAVFCRLLAPTARNHVRGPLPMGPLQPRPGEVHGSHGPMDTWGPQEINGLDFLAPSPERNSFRNLIYKSLANCHGALGIAPKAFSMQSMAIDQGKYISNHAIGNPGS